MEQGIRDTSLKNLGVVMDLGWNEQSCMYIILARKDFSGATNHKKLDRK